MGSVEPHPALRSLTAPERLSASHDLTQFSCGEPVIDDWLRNQARAAEGRTARTYVVCQSRMVIGYYCIATGSVERKSLPKAAQRRTPDPVPIGIVGRIGVSATFQGQGLGQDLLQDAVKRVLQAADIIGVRAIVIHALNDRVMRFYREHGFEESPIDSRTMFLPLETAQAAL